MARYHLLVCEAPAADTGRLGLQLAGLPADVDREALRKAIGRPLEASVPVASSSSAARIETLRAAIESLGFRTIVYEEEGLGASFVETMHTSGRRLRSAAAALGDLFRGTPGPQRRRILVRTGIAFACVLAVVAGAWLLCREGRAPDSRTPRDREIPQFDSTPGGGLRGPAGATPDLKPMELNVPKGGTGKADRPTPQASGDPSRGTGGGDAGPAAGQGGSPGAVQISAGTESGPPEGVNTDPWRGPIIVLGAFGLGLVIAASICSSSAARAMLRRRRVLCCVVAGAGIGLGGLLWGLDAGELLRTQESREGPFARFVRTVRVSRDDERRSRKERRPFSTLVNGLRSRKETPAPELAVSQGAAVTPAERSEPRPAGRPFSRFLAALPSAPEGGGKTRSFRELMADLRVESRAGSRPPASPAPSPTRTDPAAAPVPSGDAPPPAVRMESKESRGSGSAKSGAGRSSPPPAPDPRDRQGEPGDRSMQLFLIGFGFGLLSGIGAEAWWRRRRSHGRAEEDAMEQET